MQCIIKQGSAGSFLEPPTHPSHHYEVTGHGYFASIMAAAKDPEVDIYTRTQAKTILRKWRAPAITNKEVQDWIYQVLGYFKHCYKSLDPSLDEEETWYASNVRIDTELDPVVNQNQHVGVHFIKKYYPKFVLTHTIAAQAYWGTKHEKPNK